ncbi:MULTISPECIES: GNAT family N-acetyltransferase [unclassified Bacillus (in: firmicutes)]|uniref:GNAT family N-acetyltransferase n=1 Tax=unclassified Bacillus (in: firmicutes) TaxID=185979 RepID=UPI0008F13BC9|nr:MULTISPECIES: GNAT family N-acetyltransferase [unclassified Bacillus (in: firmicutes)]SFA72440.1 Predicted acetyltransferase [Bacillus sp. UNCCL13]SFQ62644.1 Predicted acetyltransferase [Bacillus sp. cl95]
MIRLIEAKKEDEKYLHNIMQFYIYEFSKYIPSIKFESDGSFKTFDLSSYWAEDHLFAYLIKYDDELIGFSLVEKQIGTTPNTIREFFISHKFAGMGFGKQAALHLFNRFPGDWKITQIEKNEKAQKFWRSVISQYTNGNFSEHQDENKRSIQIFSTSERSIDRL